MKTSFFLFFILFIFSSCERAIEFELKESATKLVVEATIENDQFPIVILSKSLNYFGNISPQLLAESFIYGAQVTITHNSKKYSLKEYSVNISNGYNLYYYSSDTVSASSNFLVGNLNQQYALDIIYNGEQFEAKTTIPNITKRIDSLWWKPVLSDTSGQQVNVMLRATDPKGFGDYIRYFTKRNKELFLPGFTSAYDDVIIDGTTYDLEVEPGIDRNRSFNENKRAFKRGDTVTLKLSNIDKATFDFWRTMEYTYSSVGNPFSSPITVIGNISNGALGYFGGYASQYRSIIIPK